jgi:hypothetical protein
VSLTLTQQVLQLMGQVSRSVRLRSQFTNHKKNLWLEGVRPSPEAGGDVILVKLDPDGVRVKQSLIILLRKEAR